MRVGEAGALALSVVLRVEGACLRRRGSGLPSAPKPASSGSGLREARTGVMWVSRRAEDRGCGEPVGETLRFLADAGSLEAMSRGVWLTYAS